MGSNTGAESRIGLRTMSDSLLVVQFQKKTSIAPEKLLELLDALPEPSQSLAWLLALTGLRIGKLLALRWHDIDLERGCLRVRQTVYEGRFDDPKTRRSRRRYPWATEESRSWLGRRPSRRDPEALVFASGQGTSLNRRNFSIAN